MSSKQLIIVLDESTSQKNENPACELGKSLCFWVAYVYDPDNDNHPTNKKIPGEQRYETAILMKSINAKPVRSGAIYNDVDTPIKICLDGILRALEACKYLINKHEISELMLISDCKPALEFVQKENTPKAVAVVSLCNQLDEILKEYKTKISNVQPKHVSKNDYLLFKDIDGIAKTFRSKIDSTFNK